MFKKIIILVLITLSIFNFGCDDDNSVSNTEESNLYAFGSASWGKLGDGGGASKNTFTKIGNSSDWISVKTGYTYSIGIKSDGSLWVWGLNEDSLLGDGTSYKNIPTRVDSSNDWQSICAGWASNLALKKDGSLWAWGKNENGQLGDGTFEPKKTPTRIDSSNDWKSISIGSGYSLGIKKDGSLWEWGYIQNESSDGNGKKLNIPTKIGNSNDWLTISVGGNYSLALKKDGSLWAWGLNSNGQLGVGTQNFKNEPTQIGVSNDWLSISAGIAKGAHSLAIKKDGSLWGWGANYSDQLGDSSIKNQVSVPSRIGNSNDWLSIGAGDSHSLGIKKDGSLWAWGRLYLSLNGLNDSFKKPTQIDNSYNWQDFSLSHTHIMAIKK